MDNKQNGAPRERLASRLGFILISAGCAIGIGNVWKFPYITGQNGGGFFVLLYLLFLVVMGIPVMTMEFSMGRAAQKSPTKLYQELEPEGSKWHIHGFVCWVGNIILMLFYTTVAGWMLRYFFSTAAGTFEGLDAQGVDAEFGKMMGEPGPMIGFMAIVVVVGFIICTFNLQKGLEKVTKVMMIALLIIMVVLAIHSFTMDGAAEGLKFYLMPSFENMKKVGIFKVITAAMNQAFFTLSLGMGSMAIFGSYINKDRSLMGESVNVAVLDTFVAITSGLIIFPACFSFGVQPDSGPNLIFVTLPNIFNSIPGGRIWGSLFFIFMFFAAFSTVLAVFQNIMACTIDVFGWSKIKTAIISCIVVFVFSIPCCLGFNVWGNFHPLGGTTAILDLEDFLVSNLILPFGSFLFVVFCTTRYGWGWEKFEKEANEGKGLKVARWMRPYMTYVLPILILSILVVGLVNYFWPTVF